MSFSIVEFFIGLMVGVIAGSVYDYFKISRIIDHTILTYRIKEEEYRKERLKKYLDEQKGGEE